MPYSTFVLPYSSWNCEVNPLGSPTSCSMASVWQRRIVWISSGLWFCGRSEIESKSSRFRCLSPRRLVASNLCLKLVTRCSQQVILVLLIYCREDRATLVPIHIGNLSGFFVHWMTSRHGFSCEKRFLHIFLSFFIN